MIVPRQIQTSADVAEHYDELDPFYREIWGEHIHHGLWMKGDETPDQAVEALIAHLASRLALEPGQHVCDVGCGYGATAEWFATHHGVRVTGVTLSSAQLRQAEKRRARTTRLMFMQQDWLENSFENDAFDRIIAIESSEHMPDKQRFFDEAYRTLRPGGRLGIYAWLARDHARLWEKRYLLEPVCREGRLPGMGSEADYRNWAEVSGFILDAFEDLSKKVRRTWTLCAGRVARKLATHPQYRRFLLDARSKNRVFALSLLRIWTAYVTGSMRYGLIVASKPAGNRS